MKPALQLLVLTLGQGLAGGLTVGLAYLDSSHDLNLGLAEIILAAALLCALIGGIASFFHMHHMSAARYILRGWRTSWLSREAVTTGLFGGVVFLLALWTVVGHPSVDGSAYVVGSWVVVAIGLLAMFVTAMLYATIPAMLSWHSPVTVLNLLAMGILGGGAWVVAVSSFYPEPRLTLAASEFVVIVAAGIIKAFQWHVFAEAKRRIHSETGFGLPFAPYRLQDTGTTKPPYRTQTQTHPRLDGTIRWRVGAATAILLGIIPAVLLVLWIHFDTPILSVIAALSVTAGSVTERWLFFRDATHSSYVFLGDEPSVPARVPTTKALIGR